MPDFSRQTWEAPLKRPVLSEQSSNEVTLDSLPGSHLAAAAGAPKTPYLSAWAT